MGVQFIVLPDDEDDFHFAIDKLRRTYGEGNVHVHDPCHNARGFILVDTKGAVSSMVAAAANFADTGGTGVVFRLAGGYAGRTTGGLWEWLAGRRGPRGE